MAYTKKPMKLVSDTDESIAYALFIEIHLIWVIFVWGACTLYYFKTAKLVEFIKEIINKFTAIFYYYKYHLILMLNSYAYHKTRTWMKSQWSIENSLDQWPLFWSKIFNFLLKQLSSYWVITKGAVCHIWNA